MATVEDEQDICLQSLDGGFYIRPKKVIFQIDLLNTLPGSEFAVRIIKADNANKSGELHTR